MEIKQFEINDKVIDAFNYGFSDYVVPLPYMNREVFINRMIISNCTKYSCSSICIHDGQVVGVLLASENENIFMVNALCVIPEFRGKGAAKLLMNDAVKKSKRKKIVLEVIRENHRAINFYKNMGFEITGNIAYINGRIEHIRKSKDISIRDLSINEIFECQNLIDIPVNWQNRIQCIMTQDFIGKGCFINDEIAGFIIYTDCGAINIKQLYVVENERLNGIGSNLIYSACKGKGFSSIFIETMENKSFFEAIGAKEKIHLYQMEFKKRYLLVGGDFCER